MNRYISEVGHISVWITTLIATALLILGASFVVVKKYCIEQPKTMIEMDGVVALSLITERNNYWLVTVEDIEGNIVEHRCSSFHEAFILVEELRWRKQ